MDDVRERVRAFVGDFEVAHASMVKPIDFDVWRGKVAAVDQKHCLAGAAMHLAGSFGSPPDLSLETEMLVECAVDGDQATVLAKAEKFIVEYREYRLRYVEPRWMITEITQYSSSPAAPYLDSKEQARLCDPPGEALREFEFAVDGELLFIHGREVSVGSFYDDSVSTGLLEVEEIGSVTFESGVLTTGDFAYGSHNLASLVLRVDPGTYPVRRSMAFGRNVALRVDFLDRPVVRWHPADAPGGGHNMPVDAGNVAIVDATSLAKTTVRTQREQWDRFAGDSNSPSASFINIDGVTSGVIVSSGFGDGVYPAFWGVDANGLPVTLVVSFQIVESRVSTDEPGSTPNQEGV